ATTVPRQLLVGVCVLDCSNAAPLVLFDEPRLPGTRTDPEDRPQWRNCSDCSRQSAEPPGFLGSRELMGGPNKTNYPLGAILSSLTRCRQATFYPAPLLNRHIECCSPMGKLWKRCSLRISSGPLSGRGARPARERG